MKLADDWKLDGLCAQVDPDLWYPEHGESGREAIRVCQGCPVLTLCLEYALDNHEEHGIWGGLTPAARRAVTGPIHRTGNRRDPAINDEVARLTHAGRSAREIGEHLGLDRRTITKIRSENRQEAAA